MEKTIKLGDKSFRLYITEAQILAAVRDIAAKINIDYAGKTPLIVPILNGSFMFASDLVKELSCQCEISFIKASSYRGTSSTGELTALIGINEDVKGRDIIITAAHVTTNPSTERSPGTPYKTELSEMAISCGAKSRRR